MMHFDTTLYEQMKTLQDVTTSSKALFAEPYVLTQGGPLGATRSLVLHMYEQGFRWWRIGEASALAVLLLLITLIATLLQLWLQGRRRVTS